jgi:hypothetical protein
MSRRAHGAVLALGLSLAAGCPIPQTVPEYPKGSPITPPRIVAESAVPQSGLLRIPIDCGDVDPWYVDLSAVLIDEDVAEPVEARWFVDYVPDVANFRVAIRKTDIIGPLPQADKNRPDTARSIPAFRFYPYGTPPPLEQETLALTNKSPGVIHVVELVLSNGFRADPPDGTPQFTAPRRTPLPGFETQVFRWTFLLADDPTLPCPGDPPPP